MSDLGADSKRSVIGTIDKSRRELAIAILPALWLANIGWWKLFWSFTVLDAAGLALAAQHLFVWSSAVLVAPRVFIFFLVDSISARTGLATRSPKRNTRNPAAETALAVAIYGASLVLTFVAYGNYIGSIGFWAHFPSSNALHASLSEGINHSIVFIESIFGPAFTLITIFLSISLNALEKTLSAIPWPLFYLVLGFVGWRSGGFGRLILFGSALTFIGLMGYWQKAIDTSTLVIAALIICTCIGIPLGIVTAKNRVVRAVMIPILDFMQTMPSFVYLLPAVAFFL